MAMVAADSCAEEVGKIDVQKLVSDYRAVIKSHDIGIYSKAALEFRKGIIANDSHRPIFHFTGPESWINDPNGPIFYKGKCHLFYQFDPIVNGGRSGRTWGHAVSDDLVHWKDWPGVPWPDTQYDRSGVFSGNTVVDDGKIKALYSGNVNGWSETYGMLAWSDDGGITFQKQMVMPNSDRPNATSPVHWDGQVWKDGNQCLQLIGGTTGSQGADFLWKSPDLVHWTFINPLFVSATAAFFELPYLIPLDGRHVLMSGAGLNPYWIGSYDDKLPVFLPDKNEPESFDAGTYYSFNNVTVGEGVAVPLKGVSGSALEIVSKFSPGKAKRFGIKVRASADESVSLPVWFDSAGSEFGSGDRSRKCYLKPGEDVTMKIFVDQSIMDVYVGGRVMTRCTLTIRPPSSSCLLPRVAQLS